MLPARSGLLKELSQDVPTIKAAKIFGISWQSVIRSRNSDANFQEQIWPIINRDRISGKLPLLRRFFQEYSNRIWKRKSIISRFEKKFLRQIHTVYNNKQLKALCENYFPQTPEKKSHEYFSGDQYSDPRWIALQKYTKLREEILNKRVLFSGPCTPHLQT